MLEVAVCAKANGARRLERRGPHEETSGSWWECHACALHAPGRGLHLSQAKLAASREL